MPTEVELKPLPSHLKYEFLDSSHQFPIIVNPNLDGPYLEQLLDVLHKHKLPLDIVLMTFGDLVLRFACTAFFR